MSEKIEVVKIVTTNDRVFLHIKLPDGSDDIELITMMTIEQSGFSDVEIRTNHQPFREGGTELLKELLEA